MQQPIQLRKSHENVSVPCLKMNGLMRMVAIAPLLLTSSLKKHVFYNWLINNILYLCVT